MSKEKLRDIHEGRKEFFRSAKSTFIENWPRTLCQLSIAQTKVQLSLDETVAFETYIKNVWNSIEQRQPIPEAAIYDTLAERISDAMQLLKCPTGWFIRLGSRSPKDSYLFHDKKGRCGSEHDALAMLTCMSERVVEDLWDAINMDYPVSIFVRQWLDIAPWTEFRCFMKNRKLIGVSQYQYHDTFAGLPKLIDSIRWAIEIFFEQFRIASHLDDVIFDVFVRRHGPMHETTWEVKLLEINPFGAFTDPCLFDWRDMNSFDGSTLIRS